MSYFAAVGSACGTGVLIRMGTAPYLKNAVGARLVVMNALTSLLCCAVGGWMNNFVIRAPEAMKGIGIQDPENGKTMGTSKMCANAARWQTANSRVAMAMPLLFPAFMMTAVERLGMMPRRFLPLESLKISLLTVQLIFAVPISMACYPQI